MPPTPHNIDPEHLSIYLELSDPTTSLSDKTINLAQQTLKSQFPLAGGLNDPVLIESNNGFWLEFQIHTQGVQIHHISANHWVCSSTIDPTKHTLIADSLASAYSNPDNPTPHLNPATAKVAVRSTVSVRRTDSVRRTETVRSVPNKVKSDNTRG